MAHLAATSLQIVGQIEGPGKQHLLADRFVQVMGTAPGASVELQDFAVCAGMQQDQRGVKRFELLRGMHQSLMLRQKDSHDAPGVFSYLLVVFLNDALLLAQVFFADNSAVFAIALLLRLKGLLQLLLQLTGSFFAFEHLREERRFMQQVQFAYLDLPQRNVDLKIDMLTMQIIFSQQQTALLYRFFKRSGCVMMQFQIRI